jgi:multiple antibiotic resistance protein
MTVTTSELLLFAISLLAMFSPLATLGPAAALLGEAPSAAQRAVALLVARNYVAVTVLTVLLGNLVLGALGISTAALTFTGGAALLHQGWPLMTRAGKATDREVAVMPTPAVWDSLAAVPLTFPITIGGGTIAVVISAASRAADFVDLAAVAAVCILMGVPVFLTIYFAGRLVRRLSSGAVDTVNRLSGIILFGLGIQLAVKGLLGLYHVADAALKAA